MYHCYCHYTYGVCTNHNLKPRYAGYNTPNDTSLNPQVLSTTAPHGERLHTKKRYGGGARPARSGLDNGPGSRLLRRQHQKTWKYFATSPYVNLALPLRQHNAGMQHLRACKHLSHHVHHHYDFLCLEHHKHQVIQGCDLDVWVVYIDTEIRRT